MEQGAENLISAFAQFLTGFTKILNLEGRLALGSVSTHFLRYQVLIHFATYEAARIKRFCTRYQVPLYLWRIENFINCCKV